MFKRFLVATLEVLSRAILLTFAPPLIGLTWFYRSIYDFSYAELSGLIFRQLWFVNSEWLLIAFIVNVLVLLDARSGR